MATKAEKTADMSHALETLSKYLRQPVREYHSHNGERGNYGPSAYSGVKDRQTVYCIVGHVSKSGMSRDIRFYVVYDGELVSLTWAIATVLGLPLKSEGLRIGGAGLDMRFAVRDHLAHKLGGEFKSGSDFRIDSL